jgi:hypothetical protein
VTGRDEHTPRRIRGVVQTFTASPVMAWCGGCELHWQGERCSALLADHVRQTGHTGWAWMPVRFVVGPYDPAQHAARDRGGRRVNGSDPATLPTDVPGRLQAG